MNKLHIFLVEDNEGDIRLTQEIFKDMVIAHDLSIARDGQEALDFLYQRGAYSDAERPDFVLLDVNLPLVDGGEVLRTIKEDDELCDIKVMVLTSSSLAGETWRKFGDYADGYLTKPIDIAEFLDAVSELEG